MAKAKRNLAAWQLDAALDAVEQVLVIDPERQRALQLQATILGHLGRYDDSLAVAKRAIELYPVDSASRRQIKALGHNPPPATHQIAIEIARSKAFNPSNCADCAAYLYDAELFTEAVELCELGLAASRNHKRGKQLSNTESQLKLQMAMALEAGGKYRQASALFRELLPESRVGRKAATGLARCLLDTGRPEQAELVLEAANADKSDPRPFSPLALDILQAQGKLLESYHLYRRRPLSQAMAKAFNMSWAPEKLNIVQPSNKQRTALIVSEGGPGDELRFSTIYRDLSQVFHSITITCDPRLETVMRRNFPQISFVPVPRFRREFVSDMSDRMNLPDALLFQCISDKVIQLAESVDIACSALDTLADLRPDFDAFRRSPSHLAPDPFLKKRWSEQFPPTGKARIGVAWRSMLQSVARNRHYLSVEHLRPFEQLRDCEFWLLQPHATVDEIEVLRKFLDIKIPHDLDLVDDFEGQISFVSCLDAVVSPFTTTGELSGACGVPTIFLSTAPNTAWRCRDDGGDVFHPSGTVVTTNGVRNKTSAVEGAVNVLMAEVLARPNASFCEAQR